VSVAISYEVFPPKTAAGLGNLGIAAKRLGAADPKYISVTFGAGGSDCNRSFSAIETVADAGSAPIAGHLTCVGVPAAAVETVIDRYAALGVTCIVALRGDPPDGIDAPYRAHPKGFQRTADLVAAIVARGGFDVAVSAYPETHTQSPSAQHDLDVLAEKVDAGATSAMTQMFFDNDYFLRYRDRVRARGIDIPIIPGIFPIHSFPAVARFAARCGATIPPRIAARFDGLDDDAAATHALATDVAVEQIRALVDEGVDHVHLYTLNRAELALSINDRLVTP